MTQITNEDTHALFWEDSFYTLWLADKHKIWWNVASYNK